MRWILWAVAGICLSGSAWAASVNTNPLNYDPQVKEAFAHFYSLDFAFAIPRFEHIRAQHPGDPQATAYLLEAVLFQELYRQDLLDTTFYANDGFLTGRHATRNDPEARKQILQLAQEGVHEAEERLSKNPNDVNALYARGWIRAQQTAYMAMVDRDFRGGFRLATKAKDDEERVLQLDPSYVDAKLVSGVYQYVVGALPWPFKLLIGFAGITGSKTTGMAMLKDAGEHGVNTSVEARTVIALFLRRESKYREAIDVVSKLQKEYPRDFLFHLEEGNLRKDAGEGMAAVQVYEQVLKQASRPGYFFDPQLELAYFGLGEALRGQRRYPEAAEAYEKAASSRDVGPELKVRSLLAAGECRDVMNQRSTAVKDYQDAIDAGPNTSRADTARKRLKTPYKEK